MITYKKHKTPGGLDGFRVFAGDNCLGTIYYFPDGPMTWKGVTPDGTRFSASSKPKITQRLRVHAAAATTAPTKAKRPQRRSTTAAPHTITATADNGDIYEAIRQGINEPWTINYPEGSDRFSGSEPELRAHIRRLISKGSVAKIAR